ncbi:MAG: hypothetical protein JWQ89_2719 [Devosia sp.]|uniref:hypothetical protein n=1 Tax=Devosia sp. TaxID=1871048 RepID=UPI00263A1223|nr:hypothetical protein [Devosia sp.]MDB5540992.1 hypothetical protein [Devosia sp.]
MESAAPHRDLERLARLGEEIRQSAPAAPDDVQSGRGLVVVAGGARVFTNAFVLLHMLRHALDSALPVELWHFGASEMSPAMAALLEPLDVVLVDAEPLIAAKGANVRDGWQLKPFAMLHSRFEEVLLLDADQVPVSDPALVFDWAQYRQSGAMFWPDIIDLRETNPVWDVLGLQRRQAVSFESGQLLVNKAMHRRALAAAVRLNEAADDLYQLVYGDKDTFLLAWDLLGASYTLAPHRPYADEFHLVQRDFDGHPLFQHRTNAKWRYGGEQRKLPGFVHEAACLAALDRLQANWSGRVFSPPDRSAAARAIEAGLVQSATFELSAPDERALRLELRPHAEVGQGRAHDRRHWWVEEGPDGARLVFSDGERRTLVLDGMGERLWQGMRLGASPVEITLAPVQPWPAIATSPAPGLVDDFLRAAGTSLDDPGLTAAMVLLARVTPGVADRLRRLAQSDGDARRVARLQAIAEAVDAARAPARRDVDRTLDIGVGYKRPNLA